MKFTFKIGSFHGHLLTFVTALSVILLSLIACSEAAKSYEESEALFEKSVNFNSARNTRELLTGPGWTVYEQPENNERTKDLPYFVLYQVSWAFESQNCVGWNPTLLLTCTGDGKAVLINKGSAGTKTDCAATASAVVCTLPQIEEHTSLSSSIKSTDIMTFECRGKTHADLLAGIGFRAQDLACNSVSQVAKQGLKLDVLWGGNQVAYSFQCKTIDSVLTTFDDKGHCMSMIRSDDCDAGDSGSPCLVSLPKRYLTQIDEFFDKNPTAISPTATTPPMAQFQPWYEATPTVAPANTQFG